MDSRNYLCLGDNPAYIIEVITLHTTRYEGLYVGLLLSDYQVA